MSCAVDGFTLVCVTVNRSRNNCPERDRWMAQNRRYRV